MTIRVAADAFALGVEAALATMPVRATIVEREALPDAAREADALIVRSTVRVDAALLAGTPVRFVATATVGDDHLDKHWLASHGVRWANAAGSSTGAVVEYIAASIVELVVSGRMRPGMTLGVIGMGRIGRRVAALGRRLGFRVLGCDPPRAARRPSALLVPLDRLLAEADVLTLHVPLTRDGPHPTWRMLNAATLARFRGRGVINTARGDVIDPAALADWLDRDPGRWIVLDCWPDEPALDERLLAHPQLAIGTPHIAGHSLDGKANNTAFACRALAAWIGVPFDWRPERWLPTPAPIPLDALPAHRWEAARAAVAALYPIRRDDAFLRSLIGLDRATRASRVRAWRRAYPPRRAWSRQRLRLAQPPSPAASALLAALGIRWEVS